MMCLILSFIVIASEARQSSVTNSSLAVWLWIAALRSQWHRRKLGLL